MSVIVLPHTPVSGQVVPSVGQLGNFTALRDAFNNTAVQTDVAKTIAVAHTWAADILFADALYDIGKSGATRPRHLFLSGNLTLAGAITGATTIAASGLTTVGYAYNAVISGSAVGSAAGSFGANYYNTGAARVRPDTGKAGLMWEMDATDSVYLQYISAGGVASIPFRVTTAGAVTIPGAVTTNGGLQTFGAADSAGAGFRTVRVPN